MARLKYFVDLADGTTLGFDRADYDQPRAMPRVYHPEHGWMRATRVVELKANPSRHKCDDRCLHATGRTMKCECACGGKNHGKGVEKACTAEKLSLMIEDAVNAGTGRNIVTVAQITAMATSLGYHTIRHFTDPAGDAFLAFTFPADESELTISADPG